MIDDFHQAIDELHKMSGSDHSYAMTWLIARSVLELLRYVITGLVVFGLGRRMINAFTVAIAASHQPREPQ